MSQITFTRPDGKECSGYYVEPAAGKSAPGIVVIQEWWGVNDQIKGVADKLAAQGYRALVPDLYRGKVGLDHKEAEHLMQGLNFGDAAGQDIRGAVQYLKTSSARVGVTGFCMGGALALLTAVFVPEADATVAWYGFPPLEYIDASKITAPLMGHFAIDDAFFPIAQVDALEEKLKAAGVKYTFHRYNAQHAFANETNVNKPIPAKYDADAAAVAWQRTVEFFDQHLGVGAAARA
jgi:carboxymethylenebutenolidase